MRVELSRHRIGRMTVASPINGGFGASSQSDSQLVVVAAFESVRLFFGETVCRSSSCPHKTWTQITVEGNRHSAKVKTMPLRSTTRVLVTSGLFVVAGITCGCQSSGVGFRSMRLAPPWQRTQPRPSVLDESRESDTYIPQLNEAQPRLSLPPAPEYPAPIAPDERPLPVPPALDLETPPSPQARRWAPTRSNNRVAQNSQLSPTSESQENGLPPARVTYDASETTTDEPIIAPAPEYTNNSQPRLFRPAGSVKNVYESVKRKFSRSETTHEAR